MPDTPTPALPPLSITHSLAFHNILVTAWAEAIGLPREACISPCCRATAELVAQHMLDIARRELDKLDAPAARTHPEEPNT